MGQCMSSFLPLFIVGTSRFGLIDWSLPTKHGEGMNMWDGITHDVGSYTYIYAEGKSTV